MKKILSLILFIPLIFTSCGKNYSYKSITIDGPDYIFSDSPFKYIATVDADEGADTSVYWTIDDTSKGSIDSNGFLTINKLDSSLYPFNIKVKAISKGNASLICQKDVVIVSEADRLEIDDFVNKIHTGEESIIKNYYNDDYSRKDNKEFHVVDMNFNKDDFIIDNNIKYNINSIGLRYATPKNMTSNKILNRMILLKGNASSGGTINTVKGTHNSIGIRGLSESISDLNEFKDLYNVNYATFNGLHYNENNTDYYSYYYYVSYQDNTSIGGYVVNDSQGILRSITDFYNDEVTLSLHLTNKE